MKKLLYYLTQEDADENRGVKLPGRPGRNRLKEVIRLRKELAESIFSKGRYLVGPGVLEIYLDIEFISSYSQPVLGIAAKRSEELAEITRITNLPFKKNLVQHLSSF